LCSKCEALPIDVHPPTHPLLKMRSPETVIPTVYRVGGTTLIPSQGSAPVVLPQPPTVIVQQPSTADVSVSAEQHVPERAEASVQLNQPETSDVAVSTAVNTIEIPAELLASSADIPIVESKPELFTAPSSVELLVDYFGSSMKEFEQKTDQVPVSIPAASSPSLISTFLKAQSPARNVQLRAVFISDNNVDDGQVFPAGAEFVKSWRMQNDGEVAWPETTYVVFVAGDRLPAFEGAPNHYLVGKVEPGAFVDIYAGDMKAPETPGMYVSYWRLSDGSNKPFGQSIWCDIVVPTIERSVHESLSSSEVIMPVAAPERSNASAALDAASPDSAPSNTVPSTPTMRSDTSSSEDGESSISLLDEFETASDAGFWDESRSQVIQPPHNGDVEYVVLYDDESTDEE